jgi:hypothetical protein
LKDELAAARRETPRNPGRIDRLTQEIAATERLLATLCTAVPTPAPPASTPVAGGQRPTHAWIGRFAGRLMQLRPAIGLTSAVRYAVMSIHHAAELDPSRAAELLVMADPVARPVDGPRVGAPRETHPSSRDTLFVVRRAVARMSSGVPRPTPAASRR